MVNSASDLASVLHDERAEDKRSAGNQLYQDVDGGTSSVLEWVADLLASLGCFVLNVALNDFRIGLFWFHELVWTNKVSELDISRGVAPRAATVLGRYSNLNTCGDASCDQSTDKSEAEEHAPQNWRKDYHTGWCDKVTE